MNIIGIDCGKSGAISWTDNTKTVIYAMPKTPMDIYYLLEELKSKGQTKVFTEHVWARKGDTPITAFALGYNLGEIKALLSALKLSYELVSPQKWMGLYGSGRPKEKANRKLWLKEKAQGLYPDIKVTQYGADALLIMEYGRRKEYGLL